MENSYFSDNKELSIIRESAPVSNLTYSITGDDLVYTVGDSLKVHAAATGILRNIITIDVHKLAFLQRNTILHTSVSGSTIRYLSLHDNKHMRSFSGHSGSIDSLSSDSKSDIFMSVGPSEANLWDIRMANAIKKVPAPLHIGALGSDGQYVLCDNSFTRIFDMRQDNGPIFTTAITPGFYKRIWYTADANWIVLRGTNNYSFVSKDGKSHTFIGLEHENDGDTAPDSGTLLCCSNRHIFAYRIDDRRRIGTLETETSPNIVVRANPHIRQFACATADTIRIFKL